MILTLKNIGKIKDARVELNGITVIVGENNTGKSTVGKILYSVFNSFYKIEEQIYKERVDNIERTLLMMYRNTTNRFASRINTEEIANTIIHNAEKYRTDPELLKQELIDFIIQYEKNYEQYLERLNLEELSGRILEIINVSGDEILRTVLSKKIDAEFNGQVNNIYNDKEGHIELTIKNERVSILVRNNNVDSISDKFYLNTEAIYIDDPFVLDEDKYSGFAIRYSRYSDHRNHLKSKLFGFNYETNVIDEIITTNKLEKIYSKINTICSGEVVRSKPFNFGYKKLGTEKVLDMKNISTGLKTFVILKTLLLNGNLEENGTIILDEPEIHLHPEWQLIFAELIVLIQKEFGMHILLNTHSPYFLHAIEVYAAKYKIADKCNYYISDSDGDISIITDVTNNIEVIYRKLARPLQELENERYNYD